MQGSFSFSAELVNIECKLGKAHFRFSQTVPVKEYWRGQKSVTAGNNTGQTASCSARQWTPSSSPMGPGRHPASEWGRISGLVNSSGGQPRKVKGKAKRKRIELSYLFRSPAHKVEITALMEASCADTFLNATHG